MGGDGRYSRAAGDPRSARWVQDTGPEQSAPAPFTAPTERAWPDFPHTGLQDTTDGGRRSARAAGHRARGGRGDGAGYRPALDAGRLAPAFRGRGRGGGGQTRGVF